MIGNLTVDKASMNISYLLKSVKILSENGGKILRPDFVSKMAAFMGTYAIKDGKENRTPFNKLKQALYFGFISLEKDERGTCLVLTRRGEFLSSMISENTAEPEPGKRYYIANENVSIVRNLFVHDIIYNSYGRNNCGAEQSNTDIEPPKVIVKLIAEMGGCTNDEICYAIYALNGGRKGNIDEILTWDEVIASLKLHRKRDEDYEAIFEKWEIDNIANDFKILNVLSNPNIDIIRFMPDGRFYLSPELEGQYVAIFKKMPYYYFPIMALFKDTTNELPMIIDWVLYTVVNRHENYHNLIISDIRENNKEFKAKVVEVTKLATNHNKTNVYFLVISKSNSSLKN